MLDKFITYIVWWYKTVYQVLSVVWTNVYNTLRETTFCVWCHVIFSVQSPTSGYCVLSHIPMIWRHVKVVRQRTSRATSWWYKTVYQVLSVVWTNRHTTRRDSSDTGSHNRLDLIQSLVPPHYVCNGYISMQSVPIITNVVSLNPAQARCTRYNIMW
jgi:hypothetical protein